MTRARVVLVALALLGGLVGTAAAAFVSSTSNGPSTFTTRAVTSRPVISGTRVTPNSDCSAASPAETIRQGTTYYVCVQSVTDPAGIASVTADLSAIEGASSAPLFTTGGPYSGYVYRTAARTANVPLETGTSGPWSVRATNATGDSSTLAGLTYNVRSYFGLLTGEFGAAADADALQYYRLDESGTRTLNQGTGGTANGPFFGTPTKQVAGALVGSADPALQLNGGADYVRVARNAAIGMDFSLEIWVKGSASSGAGPGTAWSDSAGLIDAGRANNTNDFGMAVDATGRIVAGCGNSGATIRSAANALSDGNWHHVVFTRQQAAGRIRLYVDGAQVATATTCSTNNLNASGNVYFGLSHESGLYLTASIDEAAMYQRVLSAADVLDHFKLGTGTG